MNTNKSLFIYHRREIATFAVMVTLLCLFTFTLGVHLGKGLFIPKELAAIDREAALISTLPDRIPNLQELTAPGRDALNALDASLNLELKKEAMDSNVSLTRPHQVELPKEPKAHEAGATTLMALRRV